MGADIHFYVEVRREGKWQSADKWSDDDGYFSNYPNAFYSGRNYDLFAILADVRNGSGFAGTDTGDGYVPIHAPRGIPDDSCPEIRRVVEQWSSDGHSHSWATLAELMAYDWTRTTKRRGWVSPKQYALFRLRGSPSSWSGCIGGGSVQHVSNEEMEVHILRTTEQGTINWPAYHALEDNFFAQYYTQVEWQVHYWEAGKQFLSETLPRLWRLGAHDDVRCVYFFDN